MALKHCVYQIEVWNPTTNTWENGPGSRATSYFRKKGMAQKRVEYIGKPGVQYKIAEYKLVPTGAFSLYLGKDRACSQFHASYDEQQIESSDCCRNCGLEKFKH